MSVFSKTSEITNSQSSAEPNRFAHKTTRILQIKLRFSMEKAFWVAPKSSKHFISHCDAIIDWISANSFMDYQTMYSAVHRFKVPLNSVFLTMWQRLHWVEITQITGSSSLHDPLLAAGRTPWNMVSQECRMCAQSSFHCGKLLNLDLQGNRMYKYNIEANMMHKAHQKQIIRRR